ncbi:MAG TPA: transposase, partial [Chroococcales cyanobacterium]
PADIQDREGAQLLLGEIHDQFPRLQLLWGDAGYKGARLRDWVKEVLNVRLEIVKHWWSGVRAFWVGPGQEPPEIPEGFQVLPRRWVIERTFAWEGRNRRLAKDYEAMPESEEAWLYLAMTRLMLKRLIA